MWLSCWLNLTTPADQVRTHEGKFGVNRGN